MKYLFLILFSISTLSHAQDYTAMTYNIKLDYPKEGKNSWTNRKPFMVNQIKFYEPDVLGVQEAMSNQMKDLDSLLTDYSYVGVGRDDGKIKGEFSAIFYKNKELKVLQNCLMSYPNLEKIQLLCSSKSLKTDLTTKIHYYLSFKRFVSQSGSISGTEDNKSLV